MNARTPFSAMLSDRWHSGDTMLCVGMDPDPQRIPQAYLSAHSNEGDAVLAFCCDIADATARYVCAFKPQFAHFGALGAERQLAELIRYIHQQHPEIPVILDAKRGDIGSTAERYAIEAFERYDADAVTVNPYLGAESIRPYLEYRDRGTIVLCRTSNPDSGWLQNEPDDDPVYLKVAAAASGWNSNNNVLLVAGATHVDELLRIRQTVGDMPLLVPGIGAQGGDLAAVLSKGCASDGKGLIINSSRAILYADPEDAAVGAAAAAEAALTQMRDLQAKVTPDRAVV